MATSMTSIISPPETANTPLDFLADDDLEYPDTDGEPMAESDFQYHALVYARNALASYFAHTENLYVSGNLLIYYEKGNIHKRFAPDVFVVFDVPKHNRNSYKIWEEGKAPDVVIEIISKSTWKKDKQDNMTLYRRLGVQEYFMYDPLNQYLKPALQGYRLSSRGDYQAILGQQFPNGHLHLVSQLLGLELRLEGTDFRLYDPSGEGYLLDYDEERARRRDAEVKLLQEIEARAMAEAKVQQMEGQLQEIMERLRRLEEETRK